MSALCEWGPRAEAYDFQTPAFAIDFCIMQQLRGVRIILDSGDPKRDLCLDVHGTELRALRDGLAGNEDLREEQQVLLKSPKATLPMRRKAKRSLPPRE